MLLSKVPANWPVLNWTPLVPPFGTENPKLPQAQRRHSWPENKLAAVHSRAGNSTQVGGHDLPIRVVFINYDGGCLSPNRKQTPQTRDQNRFKHL